MDIENNRRIFFVSVDDEIVYKNFDFGAETLEAIKKATEKYDYVIFTSGRNASELIDLSKKVKASQYVVANSGAVIYKTDTYETVLKARLDPYLVMELANLRLDKELRFYITVRKRYITDNQELANNKYIDVVSNIDDYVKEISRNAISINQIIIESKNLKKLIDMKKVILNKYPELYVSNGSNELLKETDKSEDKFYFMNLTLKNFDKKNAVNNIVDKLGVKKENTIAIGIGYNDLTLFEAVNKKIATSEAPIELKDKADFIVSSYQDNGIAEAINKVLENDI